MAARKWIEETRGAWEEKGGKRVHRGPRRQDPARAIMGARPTVPALSATPEPPPDRAALAAVADALTIAMSEATRLGEPYLSIDDVCKKYDVSRTSFYEMLPALEAAGLVVRVPPGGSIRVPVARFGAWLHEVAAERRPGPRRGRRTAKERSSDAARGPSVPGLVRRGAEPVPRQERHDLLPEAGRRSPRPSFDRLDRVEDAIKWKHEYEEQRRGGRGDPWQQPLRPLADAWTKELECGDERREMLRRQITTAMDLLGLSVTGDLRERSALKEQLKNLDVRRKTAVQAFQLPLKQFSTWMASEDILPVDPLGPWKRIDVSREPKRPRRGFEASEVALALAAGAWLDVVRGSERSSRAIFLGLLVAGPRVGAFMELDVPAFDRAEGRLVLGADEENKLKGRATLDRVSLEEVNAYVGERKEGPLFLSPEGERLRQEKVLRAWRERMDLALVIDLWPEGEEKVIETAWAVVRLLTRGRSPTVGGNPKRLTKETIQAREAREQEIATIAARIATAFRARRAGVDVHAFRKTHQSWAEAQEDPVVLPAAIDKQLGHANKGGEALREFFASRIGRLHYRDLDLTLFDPRRSAQAVRTTLDRAEGALAGSKYRGWEGLAEAVCGGQWSEKRSVAPR